MAIVGVEFQGCIYVLYMCVINRYMYMHSFWEEMKFAICGWMLFTYLDE